jgi:hypothetical protein
VRRLAVLACALWLAGCGVGPGETQTDTGASLLVTRDFGAERIGQADLGSVAEGETVMRALKREFDVDTRYGGNFVQAIDTLEGGRERGRPVDWFYYVNGVEAAEGAGTRELSRGDRVWWDRHDWGETMRVPAVVGSFPEPFLSGMDGEHLPVRVDCAKGADRECDEVRRRLLDAGVKRASLAGFGQPVGFNTLRILVGTWSDIRTDSAASRIEKGPRLSGVYARFSGRGTRLDMLDAAGKPVRSVGPGAGLIAATRYAEQSPTWVVTGTDAVGLAAAASALEEGVLAESFALAIVEGRGVALPATGLGTP